MSKTSTATAPVQKWPKRVNLCPPLLLENAKKYKVKVPTLAPVFDRVFVYPLGDADQAEKAGSIIVPKSVKEKHGSGRGLLLKAGLKAMQQLYSHGIELGHIVTVARLSPWERDFTDKEGMVGGVMVLRACEVVGSETLETMLEDGSSWYEETAKGEFLLNGRERVDPEDNYEGI